ncbi:MAG TPA: hypothetical protein VMA09_09275 [Candidatus Binataceae bacterium]|nr:hypothetical protein [Candidatus Binataceae bacterium]
MSSRIVLVAALYIHPGQEAEFEQFETAAASIMKRYGGAIERRIRCAPKHDAAPPYEVHIVSFPDDQSFEHYRADDDLAKLAGLRARAIRQTIVWQGSDLPPFLK